MNKQELLKVAKPMLFNTDMVRAILDGRKTVTRRLIKPQPDSRHNYKLGYVTSSTDEDCVGSFGFGLNEYGVSIQYAKPPFKISDILYVRETFVQAAAHIFWYKADNKDFLSNCKAWKPSIHMPKEAARIFLKVTDVRVEQLQDISEEQSWKEGIISECITCPHYKSDECKDCANQHEGYYDFMSVWDSTIKKTDLSTSGWDANPWVWVIEFEKIEV